MSGRRRSIRVNNNMQLNGGASVYVEAAYDPNSRFQLDTYQIWDWNQGPGTGLPNGWIYKGQADYHNERLLYDQLNTEMINQHGMVGEYYMTSYDNSKDRFFGEDTTRKYERKFDVMFFSDDMPEPNYMQTGWGLWADDTFTIVITKTHFHAASTQAGVKDDGTPGVDKGFQVNGDTYETEMAPRKGDFIKVKPMGTYFEVLGTHSKYQSLQGTSFWVLTIKLMKDDQTIDTSDEYNQADNMEDIATAKMQSREDTDLFDLRQTANDSIDDVAYNESDYDKSKMNDAWVGDEFTSSDNEYWD